MFFLFPSIIVFFNRNLEGIVWDSGYNLLVDKSEAIQLTVIALLITILSYYIFNFLLSGGKLIFNHRISAIKDTKTSNLIDLNKNFIFICIFFQVISIYFRIEGGYFFHKDLIGAGNMKEIDSSVYAFEYINYLLLGLISIPALTSYKFRLSKLNNILFNLIIILPIVLTGSRARIMPVALIFLFSYFRKVITSKKNFFYVFGPIILFLFLIPLLDWLRITVSLITFSQQNVDPTVFYDHIQGFWKIFVGGLIRRLDELPSLAFTIDNIYTLRKENIDILSHISFEGLVPFFARDPQFDEQTLVRLMDKYDFRPMSIFGGSSPMTLLGELYFFGKESLVYFGSALLGLIFSLYDNYIFKNFVSPKSAFIFGFLSQGILSISTSPIPTIISILSKQVLFAYACYFLLKSFSVIRELK